MNIQQILSIFGLGLLFFIFSPSQSFASNNFTTDYNVVYKVNESGVTNASVSVVLTNTSAKFYPSSYQLQLGFDSISNIKASDPHGSISARINKTSSGNNISLTFNKKSLGLSSKLPFTVSFDTDSAARKIGKIWEINIPGISNTADFASFTAEVRTPSSFGKPAYIKPVPRSSALKFDKNQLGKSGISIAYGDRQVYKFELTYHLANSNLFPTSSEIALPPNTNYQEILIKSINPAPKNVVVDKDGNWLAQYPLSIGQKKDVIVTGEVVIQLRPQESGITADEKHLYTQPTKYWQSTDADIKKLAATLKTPEQIYKYVVRTLTYDFERVKGNLGRLGATGALRNPDSAVCREFTDLFIALSRASGIPAREVDGYAYTQNSKERPISLAQDVLHAWPEYYDSEKKTWIMVDPTWGATTGGVDYFSVLDFDHFAFAIKGATDSYPVPAGGYKLKKDRSEKDVKVVASGEIFKVSQNVKINTQLSGKQIAGLPIKTKITLSNMGPGASKKQVIHISSKTLLPKDQISEVAEIPPFGHAIVDAQFEKENFLTNREASFTMRFGEKSAEQKLKIVPFFLIPWN